MSAAPDIAAALGALLSEPRADRRGKIFAVLGSGPQVGASFVARELALQAKASGHRCALIDMDFSQNSQFSAFYEPHMQAAYGALAGPYDASYGVMPFWQVSPLIVEDPQSAQAAFCGLYTVGDGRLVVTQFLWDHMQTGQQVHLARSREYWNALRDTYAVSFVDVPAIARSGAYNTVAEEVDGTVLIASGQGDSASAGALAHITQMGGRCVGAIFNRARTPYDYGDSA